MSSRRLPEPKMNASGSNANLSADDGGETMYRLRAELYPTCRSIAGEGVRATLELLRAYIPITLHQVQSGTQIFDWTVAPEWKVRSAYIRHSGGRVVDVTNSNLDVASYSPPVHAKMSLAELRRHIFPVSEPCDAIPMAKSNPSESWGFHLAPEELRTLPEGEYEVFIDSRLERGHLTYGECLMPGRSHEEVLISCHVSHPCFSDDNLSGAVVAAALAQRLLSKRTRYSYRFLFLPRMMGSIAWLVLNQSRLFRIKHGVVLTRLGTSGEPAYKMSRRGDAEVDHAFTHALKESGQRFKIKPFSPFGDDERQYCSPGIDLPVGRFMRAFSRADPPRHQTAVSDLTSVQAAYLHASLATLLAVIDILEHNRSYVTQKPYCEPQLSKYGLARFESGHMAPDHQRALLWVLNLSDGGHTLLDIAARANLPWVPVKRAARTLSLCGLLKAADRRPKPKKHRSSGTNA
jgi:aminopeptidase-like protein